MIITWEAIQKRSNLQNSYKNGSKEIKSDNFYYRKDGRAITKWGAKENSPILSNFIRVTKLISRFDGSNYIFADCITYILKYIGFFIIQNTAIKKYKIYTKDSRAKNMLKFL